MLILAVAVLLIVANGTPLLLSNLLGRRASWRIDAGLELPDGKPLFSSTKSWRGLLGSVLATSAASAILGLGWEAGSAVAAAAMCGDLLSSFIKRRLGLASSAKAAGLDQLPESLLPALGLFLGFGYSWGVLLPAVALFVLVDVALSPLLFRWGLRRVPH